MLIFAHLNFLGQSRGVRCSAVARSAVYLAGNEHLSQASDGGDRDHRSYHEGEIKAFFRKLLPVAYYSEFSVYLSN